MTYANREGTYWARCKNTSGGYENSYVRCANNALRLVPKMTYGSCGNGNATDIKIAAAISKIAAATTRNAPWQLQNLISRESRKCTQSTAGNARKHIFSMGSVVLTALKNCFETAAESNGKREAATAVHIHEKYLRFKRPRNGGGIKKYRKKYRKIQKNLKWPNTKT